MTFNPNDPLPDFLVEKFVKETKKPVLEKKKIELPPNVEIIDTSSIKKDRVKKAQEELQMMLNKDIKRVEVGTVLADRSKSHVPSKTFAKKQ